MREARLGELGRKLSFAGVNLVTLPSLIARDEFKSECRAPARRRGISRKVQASWIVTSFGRSTSDCEEK